MGESSHLLGLGTFLDLLLRVKDGFREESQTITTEKRLLQSKDLEVTIARHSPSQINNSASVKLSRTNIQFSEATVLGKGVKGLGGEEVVDSGHVEVTETKSGVHFKEASQFSGHASTTTSIITSHLQFLDGAAVGQVAEDS